MTERIYEDKKSALKAKVCFHCESKMNSAYVVFTLHGSPKPGGQGELHFPLCSNWCLEVFSHILMDIQLEERG